MEEPTAWERIFGILRKVLFVGMLLAIAGLCGLLKATRSALKECERLAALQNFVESEYYEDVDAEALMNMALKGYVAGLNDPYSSYLTEEEYGQWQNNESGVSTGIGVTVIPTADGNPQITDVTTGSPAEAAGLQKDDVILAADEKTAADIGYMELIQYIRNGENESFLTLTILRNGKERKVTVFRAEMELTSAYGVMLEKDIGYVRISSFRENTVQQFQEALQNLLAQGAKGIVFDVRNNGGGLVSALEKIVDPLLPAGKIATATYGNGDTKTLVVSDAKELQLPMMVLVNGNTASAAELFAASLRDFGKAELIGEKTFGKGIMQNTARLKDGGAVTLTVATYQTTRGECYHGIGITPDVTMEQDYDKMDFDNPQPAKDAQLRQAMELLQQK